MGYLKFEATEDCPEILLDADLSIFQITGNSTPEDVNVVYKPVEDWMESDGLNLDNCQCKLFFRYLSTSSHHKVFNVLRKLNDRFNEGKKLSVEWAYENIDDDMLRLGLDFASILEIPFEFSPRK
ncbi:MAG: SiaC family regulatory phosphoprotein [Salinivirgaceae bacterium]|nr:SiaC family regulatory phosphoprotein [Salinivirgaceae bacterium]